MSPPKYLKGKTRLLWIDDRAGRIVAGRYDGFFKPSETIEFDLKALADGETEIVITSRTADIVAPVNHPEVRENLQVIGAFLKKTAREQGIELKDAEA